MWLHSRTFLSSNQWSFNAQATQQMTTDCLVLLSVFPASVVFAIRYTHLRLNMFPDGGISRLKVHGIVERSWDGVPVSKVFVGLCDACSCPLCRGGCHFYSSLALSSE